MIVRYQHPYAAFRQFDREFERLARAGFGQRSVQYTLRSDVYTEGEDLVVTAAVPGVTAEVFASPRHSYTRALLAAHPGRSRSWRDLEPIPDTFATG